MSEEPNRDYAEEKRTAFLVPSGPLHRASGHITKIEQLTLTQINSLAETMAYEEAMKENKMTANTAISKAAKFFVKDYNDRSVAINGERASQVSKVSKTNRYTPPPPEDGQKLSKWDRWVLRKKPED